MNFIRRGIARLTRCTSKFPGKKRIIRLVDRLLPGRASSTVATVDGVTYALSTEDLISRAVLYEGMYQPNVLSACDRIMAEKDNGVMWDVGANIGAMSLPLLHRHKTWRSICFEPAPSVNAAIFGNRSLNPQLAGRMTIVCAPLMSRSRLVEFYPSREPHNQGVGRLRKSHNTVGRPLLVGGFSGDEILAKADIPPPDLVKIDVEGFEYEVLTGLRGRLQEAEEISVIFELSQYRYAEQAVDAADVLNLLRSFGFRICKLGSGEEVRSLNSGGVYGDFVAKKKPSGNCE